jgi:hypothetical protein
MRKLIRHIRKQPEETRRHILHFLTLVIAVILVALWVYSLGANLSDEDTQTRIEQDLKPFSVLKDNIPSVW